MSRRKDVWHAFPKGGVDHNGRSIRVKAVLKEDPGRTVLLEIPRSRFNAIISSAINHAHAIDNQR